ncbi:MAG: L,D-transpeptidase family protein [Chitinispirillaceae bacterium]|jgi:UDP-N-acetylmuramate--alanine ligase|nr:L,D-transpeptidase family protein [Chitinispirillaceae bacterium]
MEIAHQRLLEIHSRLRQLPADDQAHYLFIDTVAQKIYICQAGTAIESFDASTALRGLGCRENSLKTPTGFHRIAGKIGDGAPPVRIFRDRKDTGIDWHAGLTEDNLILGRILRIEGLEQGKNRGTGVDSFERYIYIHGTNCEDSVGTPLSHGCIVLRPEDMVRLFDLVNTGTIVFIDARPVSVPDGPCSHIHFAGIFGSGMSALAQYLQWQGTMVSGSDRMLDSPDTAAVRNLLQGDSVGCAIFPQDGSGITASTDCVCVSSAIEESNPDIAAARARSLPIVHRSDLLAAVIAAKKTIAIAGTSGKSTTTAMVFEFLSACGKAPSLITGAPLIRLEREGLIGNAFAGSGDLLVVEADESDGTLVKYSPDAGVILNISKDHKSIDETESLFRTFAARSGWAAVNADDPGLSGIKADERFGTRSPVPPAEDDAATWRPDCIDLRQGAVIVTRRGIAFTLPLPGAHNAENLCAALCVCEHFSCDRKQLTAAVAGYQGVARRFAVTLTSCGVFVVDDFAHNPAKIAAAVSAARSLSPRVIAIYQPHGFGPTRFLFDDYIAAFRAVFSACDTLLLLPVYYAGGTAKKDISSDDLAAGTRPAVFDAIAVSSREELLKQVAARARPGDCVLLMGARDPSLTSLAKKLIALFE